jgi:hypothetical protein
MINDTTYDFSQSGEVLFRIGEGACKFSPNGKLPQSYWLRARLLRKGCEENPRLLNIYKDPIPVEQKKTLCETISFTWLVNQGDPEAELNSWMAVKGQKMVFVRDNLGWQIYDKVLIQQQNKGNNETVLLKLYDISQELVQDGSENIRVICYEENFRKSMVFPVSSGLPKQRFSLQSEDTILRESLSVMVFEETEQGPKRWIEWNYIADLSKAGPYDRCFTYDTANQEIVFGDNEQGSVPQAGENNIIIARCMTTKGSNGNITSQSFEPLNYEELMAGPFNPLPASGGRDAEQLNDAMERVKGSLKQVVKAVTANDYEILAAATPGHRIMGVKAIPHYDPDSRTVGDKQAPATVTVVVLPYSEDPFPLPDESFIKAVGEHLEAYRLITMNVKVIAPLYVKITVYAEVIVENDNEERSETMIRAAVENHFKEISRGVPEGKPGFGQPVRENLLAMKIEAVPGVVQVKKVALSVRNSDSYKDNYGDIMIPPHGLPYLGNLQIRLLFEA